jgi:hypothetical protein
MKNIKRYICFYCKTTELFAGRYDLSASEYEHIKSLLNLPMNSACVDCYPVLIKEMLVSVLPYCASDLDFDRLDYFLESEI